MLTFARLLRMSEVTWQEKLAKYIEITRTLVDSMLVSATAKLHSFSGGYREVAKLLDKDKELVKQRYPDGLAILTEEYQARMPRAPMYRPSSQEGLAQVSNRSTKATNPFYLTLISFVTCHHFGVKHRILFRVTRM